MRVQIILVCLYVITMFCICCALFSVFVITEMNSMLKQLNQTIEMKCERYEQDRQVYQYGDYWVMSHVVKADAPFEPNYCLNRSAILAQGYPEDIYFITNEIMQCTDKYLSLDLAIYLATPSDLNDTITAIAYMHNCHASRELIRTKVNFHFYFHMEVLASMPIPPYIQIIVQLPMACPNLEKKSQRILPNVSAEAREHIEVVGKNILRQVSYAHLHIPIDFGVYADKSLCLTFLNEIYNSAKYMKAHQIATNEKIIYRRTTFLVVQNNETKVENMPRITNYLPFDSKDWLLDNKTVAITPVSNVFDELVYKFSYFIMYWHAPLWDDRIGISRIHRDNLFLLRASYDNYTVIFLHNAAALSQLSMSDVNALNSSSNNFASLDEEIKLEYTKLFNP